MNVQGLYKKLTRFFPTGATIFIVTTVFSVAAAAAEMPAADDEGQTMFVSAQEAVNALVAAVQEDNDAALTAIFGPDSQDLVSSGDPVADQNGRGRFLEVYAEKHSLINEDDGKVILHIGNQDYPFPIPIVQRGNVWLFDTQAGKEEILDRRIGRNELHIIEVLHAYTDAQREYAAMTCSSDGTPEFAQQLISSEGKKDGLYWETAEGEKESPFGPLIAEAVQKGYAGRLATEEDAEPYYGYYFKILKAQGEHANGGAFNYVVDGRMILGFGLVAYPAKYGSSGIMTFLVNQEGVIYEKDLGEDNTAKAADMTLFNPDQTWKRYEEPVEE
jgi:hypothetical protein